jgi:hypothetical protein
MRIFLQSLIARTQLVKVGKGALRPRRLART